MKAGDDVTGGLGMGGGGRGTGRGGEGDAGRAVRGARGGGTFEMGGRGGAGVLAGGDRMASGRGGQGRGGGRGGIVDSQGMRSGPPVMPRGGGRTGPVPPYSGPSVGPPGGKGEGVMISAGFQGGEIPRVRSAPLEQEGSELPRRAQMMQPGQQAQLQGQMQNQSQLHGQMAQLVQAQLQGQLHGQLQGQGQGPGQGQGHSQGQGHVQGHGQGQGHGHGQGQGQLQGHVQGQGQLQGHGQGQGQGQVQGQGQGQGMLPGGAAQGAGSLPGPVPVGQQWQGGALPGGGGMSGMPAMNPGMNAYKPQDMMMMMMPQQQQQRMAMMPSQHAMGNFASMQQQKQGPGMAMRPNLQSMPGANQVNPFTTNQIPQMMAMQQNMPNQFAVPSAQGQFSQMMPRMGNMPQQMHGMVVDNVGVAGLAGRGGPPLQMPPVDARLAQSNHQPMHSVGMKGPSGIPEVPRPRKLLFVVDKESGELATPSLGAKETGGPPASEHAAPSHVKPAAHAPPGEAAHTRAQQPSDTSSASKFETPPAPSAAAAREAHPPAASASAPTSSLTAAAAAAAAAAARENKVTEEGNAAPSINGEPTRPSTTKPDVLPKEEPVKTASQTKIEAPSVKGADVTVPKLDFKAEAPKPEIKAEPKPDAAAPVKSETSTEKPVAAAKPAVPTVKAEVPAAVVPVVAPVKVEQPPAVVPPAAAMPAAAVAAATVPPAAVPPAAVPAAPKTEVAPAKKEPEVPSSAVAQAAAAPKEDVNDAAAQAAKDAAPPAAKEVPQAAAPAKETPAVTPAAESGGVEADVQMQQQAPNKSAEASGESAGEASDGSDGQEGQGGNEEGEGKSEETSLRPSVPMKTRKVVPADAGGKPVFYEIKFLLLFKDLCKEVPPDVRETLMSLPPPFNVVGSSGGDGTPRSSSGGARPMLQQPGSGGGAMPQNGGMGRVPPGAARMGPPVRDARGPGGMAGGGGSQRDMRGGAGNMRGRNMAQPPLSTGYVKPLERTENAYDFTKTKPRSHYDGVMKEVRGLLNKLTLTNFDKLSDDLVEVEIVDPEELRGIVSIIFDKSLEEAHFCNMYARLCNKIKDMLPKFPEHDQADADPTPGQASQDKPVKKELTFKRCLLNKCQEEFERADRYEDLREANETEAQHAAKSRKVRMRMLGNIKFIGELFAQKILNEKIMHECVKRLLASTDEDTIECLCKLMATIGKLLDHAKAKHYMDYYFDQMAQTAEEVSKLPNGNRLKFMLCDTIDLRKAAWVPRRETTGPKTIEQIRRDAAKEGIIAGPVPPPRGGPIVDRQRPADRGAGMMGPPGRGDGRMGPGQGGMGGPGAGRDVGPTRSGYGVGPGVSGRPGQYASGDYREQRMGAGMPQQPARPGGGVLESSEKGKSSPAPAAAAAAKPRVTEEQMKKRIRSTLDEYVEMQDVKEVKVTFEEMGSRECFGDTLPIALEMCFDKPSLVGALWPLVDALWQDKVLNADEMTKGCEIVLETLEDTAVDIPAAPKVTAEFMVRGLKSGYCTWKYLQKASDKWWKETGYGSRFVGLVLSECLKIYGVADTKKSWQEGGADLSAFGVEDFDAFVSSNSLDEVFPIPKLEKQVTALLDEGKGEQDVKAFVEQAVAAPDRDVGQCLMRCVLKCVVNQLGGRAKLDDIQDTSKLIVQEEKAALEQYKTLLKTFIQKECDQAYALFAVQKYAQDLEYPTGFLSRMLATLYELEVVEEVAVRDWKNPPDNRHLFLLASKDRFSMSQKQEAGKQAKAFMEWLDTTHEQEQGA